MSGMLPVVTRMQDGSMVECITIGKEGVTGPPLVAERSVVSNVDCMCQLPGRAMRVPIAGFFALRRRLTQEFLAEMLGVRRETVNLTARLLQRAGLIQYRRGEITVRDREGLESTSCECYGVMRADLERLFRFP